MKNVRNTEVQLPTLKIAALCVALSVSMLANAQVNIDWQQCYGSLGPDWGFSIVATSSGFAVLGQVEGDPPSGMYECHNYYPSYRGIWLIGIDNEGGSSINWQNCYHVGRSQELHRTGVDNYYITKLSSESNGLPNVVVTKTDGYGDYIWEKNYGTENGLLTLPEVFGLPTPDDGIIVATVINEGNGDVSHYYGGYDCWVIKLDSEGNLLWQNTLGTGGNDVVTCLQEAADGGVLLWVNSDRTGSGNIGYGPLEKKGVLVYLDASSGQIRWQLCFERTSARSIIEMDDGYLLAGDQCDNPNGNCGDSMYPYDCYLLRCDRQGNVIWEKDYGGSSNDKLKKVFPTDIDNGFTAFANSKSTDGDVESFVQLGVTDTEKGNIWMFHVNAEGELLWELCIGSQLGYLEEMRDVIAVGDREYVIVGDNTWFDGVSSGLVECSNNLLLPNSGSNIWVLKVSDIYDYDAVQETSIDGIVHVMPNPTTGLVTITGKDLKQAEIHNTFGQRVAYAQGDGERIIIDLNGLPAGIYFVAVTNEEGRRCVQKVVRE